MTTARNPATGKRKGLDVRGFLAKRDLRKAEALETQREKAATVEIRVSELKATAQKQRSLGVVQKALDAINVSLAAKTPALREAKLKRLTSLSPSASVRLIRESKINKLQTEIIALQAQRKGLIAERPAAKRADAIRKELGLTVTPPKSVKVRTVKATGTTKRKVVKGGKKLVKGSLDVTGIIQNV